MIHRRLSHRITRRISARMRRIVTVFMLVVAMPAVAQAPPKPAAPAKPAVAAGPKELGKFDDWIAATHEEAGQNTCYAFVRAKNSVPVLPGRGEVVLTVTERPTGRDTVAISAGFTYPKDAAVTVQVDTTGLDFYTAQSSAFARDGKATVAAFQKSAQALARSPGPRGGQPVVDTFSLRGFSAAYTAISKACPAH
ncbi:MAG TPA: invasion associated locus B family protein [Acetobacteraceae bacterium]